MHLGRSHDIGWSSCCICCVLSCTRPGPGHVCVHFASSCDQEFTTLIFLAGGRRGCRGAPPLQPRKAYLHRLRLGPVVGSWRGTHLRSPFISFRATSFLCVWRSTGQKPYPWRIISFRFGCHSWCLACVAQNFHLISALSLRALLHFRYHHHYQHHRISSCVTLSRENLSRSADNTISVYYNGFPSRRHGGLHWRQSSLKGIRLRLSGTLSLSLPFDSFNMYSWGPRNESEAAFIWSHRTPLVQYTDKTSARHVRLVISRVDRVRIAISATSRPVFALPYSAFAQDGMCSDMRTNAWG